MAIPYKRPAAKVNYHEKSDDPEIDKLVEEMRDFARLHPYNPDDFLEGIMVNDGCSREFTYDNIDLRIVLSLNVYNGGEVKVWHLSVHRIDQQPMTDEWIEPFLTYFFEDVEVAGPIIVNPPNPYVPTQKQYAQRIVE